MVYIYQKCKKYKIHYQAMKEYSIKRSKFQIIFFPIFIQKTDNAAIAVLIFTTN